MAYVAMTRGRHNNEAFLYQKFSAEADHEHATPITSPDLHHLRRGNEYSAEHYFKQILHNDDRPRTMRAEAERTESGLLPEVVAEVIERHESRRRARHATWRAHVKTAQGGTPVTNGWPQRLKHAPPASISTPVLNSERYAHRQGKVTPVNCSEISHSRRPSASFLARSRTLACVTPPPAISRMPCGP
jgi:hypothetical protein